MQLLLTLMLLAVISFVLHFVWEKLHIGLYTKYEKLGQGMPLTLMATSGDVLYTILAVLFVSTVKQNILWVIHPTLAEYVSLGILGFCVALFVEYKALALKRWAYKKSMPLMFGVGVSPVLQMTLLLPFTVFSTHLTLQALTDAFVGV